jgi:hypothetical protein
MATTNTPTSAPKDPGFTVRVPAAVLATLRKTAEKQARRNPLMSETEILRRLCQRALALGAEDPRLTERAEPTDV